MKDFVTVVVLLILLILLVVGLSYSFTYLRSTTGSTQGLFLPPTISSPFASTGAPLTIPEADLWRGVGTDMTSSPYKGLVILDTFEDGTSYTEPADEYVTIRASVDATEAVNVTGWSLESLVSKTRIFLPYGTVLYSDINQNPVTDVYIAPGEFIYVVSGFSPIKTSFHTNTCSGYLNNGNAIIPDLPNVCPEPRTYLPATIENVRNYGEQCIEYVHSLAPCETPYTPAMTELIPACRAFIEKTFNYTSCVASTYPKETFSFFNRGGWYLYLNSRAELWRSNYEVIRLLDEQGRVVDVMK